MSITKRLRVVFVALVLSFVVGRPERADGGEDAIFVEYDVSEGCPDTSAFLEEIRARTPRAHFVSDAKGARVFSVSIHRQERETIGRLSTRRRGENGAPRELTGKNCDEVA